MSRTSKEKGVDRIANSGAEQPISPGLRAQLLEPFITATTVTLREWTGTEAFVKGEGRMIRPGPRGDFAVVLPLRSTSEGLLVLHFPDATATALARRIFADAAKEYGRDMISDCLGEFANVLAGQAKALLFGTPYHFSLGTPRACSDAAPYLPSQPGLQGLVLRFDSDVGEFALQLFMELAGPA
jgi:chemotaxis protein CheX